MSVAYTAPEYVGVHFVHYAFHFCLLLHEYMALFFSSFSFLLPAPLPIAVWWYAPLHRVCQFGVVVM